MSSVRRACVLSREVRTITVYCWQPSFHFTPRACTQKPRIHTARVEHLRRRPSVSKDCFVSNFKWNKSENILCIIDMQHSLWDWACKRRQVLVHFSILFGLSFYFNNRWSDNLGNPDGDRACVMPRYLRIMERGALKHVSYMHKCLIWKCRQQMEGWLRQKCS